MQLNLIKTNTFRPEANNAKIWSLERGAGSGGISKAQSRSLYQRPASQHCIRWKQLLLYFLRVCGVVCVQVLALVNASNNSCSPASIDYTEFYNTALDHTDLMKVHMGKIA